VNKAGASALVFQLAHEVFKVPGDSGFALGGLLIPPVDKQEEGTAELLTWYWCSALWPLIPDAS